MIRPLVEQGKERSAGMLRSWLRSAFELARRAPYDARVPSALVAFEVERNPVKQEHLIVAEEIADNPTAIARGHKERRTAARHR